MKRFARCSLFFVLFVVGLVACSHPSPIVQKALDAGADPGNMSDADLGRWFAQHRPVAVDIARECHPTKNNQSEKKANPTEARICSAAIAAATFAAPIHVQGTGKTY